MQPSDNASRTRSGRSYGDFAGFSAPSMTAVGFRQSFDPYAVEQFQHRPRFSAPNYVSTPPPAASVVQQSTLGHPVDTHVQNASDTLGAIKTMLGTVPPSTEFEKNIVNVMNLLIAQMTEIKYAQTRQFELNMAQTRTMDQLSLSVIKTEQYSRRECLTVTGLPQQDSETVKTLGDNVVKELSKSGVQVKAEDISAVHRNGKDAKEVTLRDGSKKKIPPSVSVKFKSANLKDELIKNYKNFDMAQSKPKTVQIFHSLSRHYSNLRNDIVLFFKNRTVNIRDGILQAGNFNLQWCKYMSPTAGLAVRLKTGEFIKGIHTFSDFVVKFNGINTQ